MIILSFCSLFIYCLLSLLFKNIVPDIDMMSLIYIFFNSIFLVFVMAKSIKEKNIYFYILIGYLLRVLVLLVDFYGREYMFIPHSGDDTERFFLYAVRLMENFSYLKDTYDYSKFLYVVFLVISPQRLFAQYLNVIFGITSLVILYKTANILEFEKNTKKSIILIASFFPHSIIFSSILLRESIIYCSFIAFVYNLIIWYKNKNIKSILLSFLFLLIASYFHSGLIVSILPVIFMYSFYNHNEENFKFNIKSMFFLIVFCFLLIFLYFEFGNLFAGRLIKTSQKLYNGGLYSDIYVGDLESGSTYLRWLRYNSIFDIILFSPLKMTYFLFSPMPLNWRGILDIFSFVMDSSVYIYLIFIIFINIKKVCKEKLLFILFFIFLINIFVFGYGTATAGTAIRHRHKILYLMLLIGYNIKDINLKSQIGKGI